MVLCLVKLRRFDEARADLDRVLASSYVPSNNACSLVVDELCNKDEGSGLRIWCCKRLFKGLCGHGHLDEAVGMLDTLCEITRMLLPVNLI
ncbi:unnamed protein product [Brassica rapa subsp. trilocularis]|uniref:(rape) hypothetical protein n=1 Tax=Brassica napus TaxID=3708 RepID=A0A816NMP3_BRANA|nr:unnamed protein product [Brassica napus]